MDLSRFKGLCEKCRKRKSCKVQCAPVEAILREGNHVHEDNLSDKVIVYPKWRERQESVLRAEFAAMGGDGNLDEELFSTDTPSPWFDVDYKAKRTRVFILRVFYRWDWSDIATAFDTSADHVRKIFDEAKKRALQALEVLDKRRAIIDDAKIRLDISEKATGKLTKTQKWFLLNKLFGLLPREIAEIYDANPSSWSVGQKWPKLGNF
jgi:hypothetical protein